MKRVGILEFFMLSDMNPYNSTYRYKYRLFSECGPRYKNEDTVGVVDMPEYDRCLFILCDGMGGHRNGDLASQTIVEALSSYWLNNPERQDCEKKFVDAANEAMFALNKIAYCGMGTTLAMIAIDGNMLHTAHCGDSRIYYCFEYDRFLCVNHLRDHIETTPEGWPYVAKGFVQGELQHIPEIHKFSKRLPAGSRFLICSDGVYNAFKEKEIEELLQSSIGIDELTGVLHERCDKAARDNYSAIVIEIC